MTKIEETCSCGASVAISCEFASSAASFMKEWRTGHVHDDPVQEVTLDDDMPLIHESSSSTERSDGWIAPAPAGFARA